MGQDSTDAFFRDLYNAELEQRHRLDSADSSFVVLLLAFSGVGIYYLRLLPSCDYGIAGCVFLALGAVFLLAFIAATVFVVLSFWPRYKAYLASPGVLGKYVAELETYYRRGENRYHTEDEVKEQVAGDLTKTLRDQYVRAAERNRQLNVQKMGHQAWVRYSITAAVVALLLNAYPAYLVQCKKSEIQRVDVVRLPGRQNDAVVPATSKDESNEPKQATAATAATTANADAAAGPPKATASGHNDDPGRSDSRPFLPKGTIISGDQPMDEKQETPKSPPTPAGQGKEPGSVTPTSGGTNPGPTKPIPPDISHVLGNETGGDSLSPPTAGPAKKQSEPPNQSGK